MVGVVYFRLAVLYCLELFWLLRSKHCHVICEWRWMQSKGSLLYRNGMIQINRIVCLLPHSLLPFCLEVVAYFESCCLVCHQNQSILNWVCTVQFSISFEFLNWHLNWATLLLKTTAEIDFQVKGWNQTGTVQKCPFMGKMRERQLPCSGIIACGQSRSHLKP